MNVIKSCSKGILKKAPAFPIATGYAKLFPILKDQCSLIFLQKAFPSFFVSNLVNVGIKHIPLGQSDGQRILVKLLPNIKELALKYKECEIDDLGTSAFISDLTSMYHETLNNRIYQT